MNFSIVIAFRDTPRERDFARKSIPSAVSLKPSEIIVGMDKPVAKSTIEYVEGIFEELSFRDYTILQVPRSAEWNFQLANVIWHCYKTCKNNKVLAFDIDSVLRPDVLKGYNMIGENGNAVVSFTKKLLIENISDRIRYTSYRYRVRTRSNVFSGIYWIWLPYYLEDIDIEEFQEIQNGIDTYMIKCIGDRGKHNVVMLKDIGVDCLDIQNEDIPWRQFQDGIWLFAHPEVNGAYHQKTLFNSIRGNIIRKLNRVMPFTALARTICYQHPWMLRGWWWAKSHRDHEIVQMASEQSLLEWGLTGAKHVKGIYDWQQQGRAGTGFG